MTLLDSILVAAMLGFFPWLVLSHRGQLRREVDSKLRSTVLRTAEDEIVFDGGQAVVLLKDYAGLGGGRRAKPQRKVFVQDARCRCLLGDR